MSASRLTRLATYALRPPTTTRAAAVDRMERTSAITHLMASLEHLANRHERRHGGMNDWSVTSASSAITSPLGRRLLDLISAPNATDGAHVARVCAALALIAPGTPNSARIAANGVLAGTSLAMHPRHHYGTDGSDQVSFLVQTASLLARAADSRTRIVDSVLWTVALQATLSYAISGWAKVAGRTWREGRALSGVTRTLTYGDRTTWQLTQRFPQTAKLLGMSVLALECSFPLAYLAGGRLTRGYVASTSAFHLGVARVMALGRFVPSFLSMHGPVEYTARRRATTAVDGVPRDDTMPVVAGLAAAAVATSATILRHRNRRLATAGRGDEQRFTTQSGNALAYRTLTPSEPTGPLFILESGMLATAEHWEHIATQLQQQGTVVTYSRAGYGPSTHAPGTAGSVDDLVTELIELTEHLAGERDVVYVGHSLGGYLAMKAAARRPVAAIVLVDSSHPEEIARSKRQELGAEALTEGISLTLHSMELGAALLVDRPDWVDSMPEPAQATMFAQFRDARMWRAARREWAAVRREFDAVTALPSVAAPVLSVSAGRTVCEDPVQGQMHREMAEAGTVGVHETIADADHDSILTNPAHARELTEAIGQFLDTHCAASEAAA